MGAFTGACLLAMAGAFLLTLLFGADATTGGWLVSGHNGENFISAVAKSQAEAWHRAVEQAEAVGMASKREPPD